MNDAFVLRGIRKHYGDREVLCGASLRLQPGKLVLVTGANGSGKTTLFRIASGLEPPDCARVTIDGITRSWKKYRSRLYSRVVYLHQRPYLLSGSVRDNLNYVLSIAGYKKARRENRISEALDWSNLGPLADRPANTLSGGEQQRVALVRACLADPDVLLLDEPAANIDLESREQLKALLRRFKQQDMAIMMIGHDPQSFADSFDTHLEMHGGRLTRPFAKSNMDSAHSKSRKPTRRFTLVK
ncbi:MAG: ABC transporter ATP-binding protein [Thiothrix sp.]|nr:MAG: ABC transporter ATP-binding protein [Thiothrix sp.]